MVHLFVRVVLVVVQELAYALCYFGLGVLARGDDVHEDQPKVV